jgi:hypothetical protein
MRFNLRVAGIAWRWAYRWTPIGYPKARFYLYGLTIRSMFIGVVRQREST